MNETDDSRGRYSITWETAGNGSVELLHYALPHHQVRLRLLCSQEDQAHHRMCSSFGGLASPLSR